VGYRHNSTGLHRQAAGVLLHPSSHARRRDFPPRGSVSRRTSCFEPARLVAARRTADQPGAAHRAAAERGSQRISPVRCTPGTERVASFCAPRVEPRRSEVRALDPGRRSSSDRAIGAVPAGGAYTRTADEGRRRLFRGGFSAVCDPRPNPAGENGTASGAPGGRKKDGGRPNFWTGVSRRPAQTEPRPTLGHRPRTLRDPG
jgi:hypothetical protein